MTRENAHYIERDGDELEIRVTTEWSRDLDEYLRVQWFCNGVAAVGVDGRAIELSDAELHDIRSRFSPGAW